VRRAVKRYTVLLEFLIALGTLPGCVWSVPTARVMPLQGIASAPCKGLVGETGQRILPESASSYANCLTVRRACARREAAVPPSQPRCLCRGRVHVVDPALRGCVGRCLLPSLSVCHVKVMFPGRTVTGFLPVGCDGVPIPTDFPFKSL
jgi:hypothetical protein